MKKIFIIITILVISACNNQYVTAKNEINSCFYNYKVAVKGGNGNEAIKYLDKNSLNYYNTIIDLSVSADSITLDHAGIYNKITVLIIRQLMPKEILLDMNGESLFIYMVNSGLVGQNSNQNVDLADIEIKGTSANGFSVVSGKKLLYFLDLTRKMVCGRLILQLYSPQ